MESGELYSANFPLPFVSGESQTEDAQASSILDLKTHGIVAKSGAKGCKRYFLLGPVTRAHTLSLSRQDMKPHSQEWREWCANIILA